MFICHRFLDLMSLLVISHGLLKAFFSVKSLFRRIYSRRDRLSRLHDNNNNDNDNNNNDNIQLFIQGAPNPPVAIIGVPLGESVS